jgi:hypothetical protein
MAKERNQPVMGEERVPMEKFVQGNPVSDVILLPQP